MELDSQPNRIRNPEDTSDQIWSYNKIQSYLYHSNILQCYSGILHLGLVIHILGFNKEYSPSPGHHKGMFTGGGSIIENVYELATSGTPSYHLHLQRLMVVVIAEKLWSYLYCAAHKSDFTKVLSPPRSFFM